MPGVGPTVSLVQRLRVVVEAAGSFATDGSGTLGNYLDVPMIEGSAQLTLTQETQNPQQALQDIRNYQEEVIGKKTWSLTFNVPFHPSGVAATNGVTATGGYLGLMLKAIMGGEFLGTGTTVTAAGGWSNSATGNVATGTNLRAGGLLQWADTSGVVHAREIEAVTGQVVTLKVGLPAAPSSSDVLATGATYFWTQDPDTSLQFIVEGYELQDRWLCMGGQGTFTASRPLDGTIPTISFTITGTKWLEGDEAAGASNIHGTNLGAATYSNYEPITGQAGRLIVQTVGTATLSGATVDASEIAFTPGFEKTAVTSPSGSEGILRWRMTRAGGTAPVEGTFSTYFTGYGNWDSRDTKADKTINYQNGVSFGKTTLETAPTVQFVDVQRVDADNIAGEQITYRGRTDTDTDSTVTVGATNYDIAKSPHRIHLG